MAKNQSARPCGFEENENFLSVVLPSRVRLITTLLELYARYIPVSLVSANQHMLMKLKHEIRYYGDTTY